MPIANYKDMSRDDFIAKLAYLLKLNYECMFVDKNNDKFDYTEVAKNVYDNKIVPSGDFSYTNIVKILEEYLHNQTEVDKFIEEYDAKIKTEEDKLELYKSRCSNPMTIEQEYKYTMFKMEIERLKLIGNMNTNLDKINVFEKYQPDIFACKPRDYVAMMESLAKVGNSRVTAYADWYANAGTVQQNTDYLNKYDEYFESLDDLITLFEIDCSIIHVYGLYRSFA